MPRLTRNASKAAKDAAMQEEMHKFKAGELHSGSPTGPIVKSRDQAIAISLAVSGQAKKKGRKRELPFVGKKKKG